METPNNLFSLAWSGFHIGNAPPELFESAPVVSGNEARVIPRLSGLQPQRSGQLNRQLSAHRKHGRWRILGERQLTIRIIFEDRGTVLGRKLNQAPPLRLGEGATGGVVKVRNQMDQFDRALRQGGLDRIDMDAIGFQGDLSELHAKLLQEEQRPVIGWLSDDHPVAGREQVQEKHRTGFERAVGDHHLVGVVQSVTLGDPGAEPGMADSNPEESTFCQPSPSALAAAARTASTGIRSGFGALRAKLMVSGMEEALLWSLRDGVGHIAAPREGQSGIR